MKIPAISISRWSIDVNGNVYRTDGYVGVGTSTPNEALTVNGAISIRESNAPAALDGYGKLYVQADQELYYKKGDGTEVQVSAAAAAGAAARELIFITAPGTRVLLLAEAGAMVIDNNVLPGRPIFTLPASAPIGTAFGFMEGLGNSNLEIEPPAGESLRVQEGDLEGAVDQHLSSDQKGAVIEFMKVSATLWQATGGVLMSNDGINTYWIWSLVP